MGPLPHHLHHNDEQAALIGQLGKPEAYYFPPQLNNHGGDFPYTFIGIAPWYDQRADSRMPGKLHKRRQQNHQLLIGLIGWSPALDGTYRPDCFMHRGACVRMSRRKRPMSLPCTSRLVNEAIIPEELLWNGTPKDRIGDFDQLLEAIDWDLNVDPQMMANRFMMPKPVRDLAEMQAEGYVENWVCYKSDAFSAKELTVMPGTTVTIKDNAAYGLIVMQGHGKLGVWDIETPALIRYGQLTNDEFFVSEKAAMEGVTIVNPSTTDPIVILKHFGPNNPDLTI
jgi:hypothetical protein